MNLEQQCISLDLAKRLKELKIPQKSLFKWSYYEKTDAMTNAYFWIVKHLSSAIDENEYSAFTAAELLQLLPYHITSKEPEPFNSYRLYISGSVIVKNPECIDPVRIHIVNYLGDTYTVDMTQNTLLGHRYLTKNLWDENPANALGKMAIYLIESNIWKPFHA